MEYQGVHPLHDLIFTINKPLIGKKGVHYQKLLKDWTKIVGEDLANYAIPIKISSFKRKNTAENILYLATNNAASSAELVYHLGIIKEQINCYFGYPYIQQIKVVQASFQIQPKSEEVDIAFSAEDTLKLNQLIAGYHQDDSIKDALERLAGLILTRKILENKQK